MNMVLMIILPMSMVLMIVVQMTMIPTITVLMARPFVARGSHDDSNIGYCFFVCITCSKYTSI